MVGLRDHWAHACGCSFFDPYESPQANEKKSWIPLALGRRTICHTFETLRHMCFLLLPGFVLMCSVVHIKLIKSEWLSLGLHCASEVSQKPLHFVFQTLLPNMSYMGLLEVIIGQCVCLAQWILPVGVINKMCTLLLGSSNSASSVGDVCVCGIFIKMPSHFSPRTQSVQRTLSPLHLWMFSCQKMRTTRMSLWPPLSHANPARSISTTGSTPVQAMVGQNNKLFSFCYQCATWHLCFSFLNADDIYKAVSYCGSNL